jgi:hypothetical protein
VSSDLSSPPGGAHHSRPLSWVWVFLISAGFTLGTVGVCLASWPLSIAGAAVTLVSVVAALATGIMEDVDLHQSRDLWPIGPRDSSYRRRRSA